MKTLVFNQQSDLSIASKVVRNVIKRVLSLEKRSTNELAVYFVSTSEICRIHKEFFNDSSPTDCISFPMDQRQNLKHHILGEVFVCPKTALDYVFKRGEGINEDVYRETTLYLVHGLLHLLGYKDNKENDKQEMRAAERRYMEHLILENILLKG